MYLCKPQINRYFDGKICSIIQKVCISELHRDYLDSVDAEAMEEYGEIEYYNREKPPSLLLSSSCLAHSSKLYDSQIYCGATGTILMASYKLKPPAYFSTAEQGIQFAREHVNSIVMGVN